MKLHGIYKVKNIGTHVWLVKIYLNNRLFPTMEGYKIFTIDCFQQWKDKRERGIS
jgi:hypothetical protein